MLANPAMSIDSDFSVKFHGKKNLSFRIETPLIDNQRPLWRGDTRDSGLQRGRGG